MINVEYRNKHSKYIYQIKPTEKKPPNPRYDKNAVPDEKPEYCVGRVCIACLNGGNMCSHLSYCGAERKLKKKFRKITRKMYGCE